METQLTRRGRLLVAVLLGCLALAAVFGARSLNAVVAPSAVALLAAVVVVARTPTPTVERTTPPDGHPGERHVVRLSLADLGIGRYDLRDELADGLTGWGNDVDVVDEETISYELEYGRRGVYELGPLAGTVSDGLGLAERPVTAAADRAEVLVYPPLVDPPARVRRSLEAVVDLERRPGRDEFDRLREYVRGDSPRDVHWKSSAKRPDDDLVVKEFLGRTPTDAVRIAVAPQGDRSAVDACAVATASVAVTLLEEGVEVGVATPGETIDPAVGSSQRESILAALARLDAGEPTAPDRTIQVTATDGEAVVRAGGRAVPFRPSEAMPDDGPRSDEARQDALREVTP